MPALIKRDSSEQHMFLSSTKMKLVRKMRFMKKTVALIAGVFATAYIFLTFYISTVSHIQNFKISGLHLRYLDKGDMHEKQCQSEKTNFVFIKCMKCATESMATILRRFGYVRNLNFALPVKRNLYFGWPFPIEMSGIRTSKYPYNILMEHSIYNGSFMKSLMPKDTSFITIIRNPWKHFLSTYNYFAIGRIGKVPNENISEYLLNLDHYEEQYKSPENGHSRWCIPDHFSMTKNIMSHCLGMPLGFPAGRDDISNNDKAVDEHIQAIDKAFNLVMIADYFTESLVLLKRKMCWSFKDILYHHSNVGNYNYGLQPRGILYDIHRNWSRVDYKLFDHFNASFWTQVAQEGPDFMDEVEHFRLIQMLVERFCFIEGMWKFPDRHIAISGSRYGTVFNVTGEDCALMNTYMLPMLWAKYYERENIEPENFGDPKDRPKPAKGCSI